jgi:hypothetical protein
MAELAFFLSIAVGHECHKTHRLTLSIYRRCIGQTYNTSMRNDASTTSKSTYAARYKVFPTHIQTQLSFLTIGRRNSWARYSVRYNGKKAFVCTSNAYAHSTTESAGVECDGADTRTRFEKNLPQRPLNTRRQRILGEVPEERSYQDPD